jgi:hypothetical protein
MKERDDLGDVVADGKIMSKWILKKQGGWTWTKFVWLRIRISDGLM